MIGEFSNLGSPLLCEVRRRDDEVGCCPVPDARKVTREMLLWGSQGRGPRQNDADHQGSFSQPYLVGDDAALGAEW
jgi:hypothetical protein